MMQRVIVIGNCGAGKSTFAKKLSAVSGLELISLDSHYFKPNWEPPPKSKWEETVKHLSEKPAWVMDGNYGGTMDLRLKRADTVIFLDYSSIKCLYRITKRTLKHWGKVRPGMAKGCKERFNFEFFHYVATYNLTRRKALLEKLKSQAPEKQVFIFRNDEEVKKFLKDTETSILTGRA